MAAKKFLSGEWRNLVMANYPVEASLLKPYIPARTELDTWQGNYYVSLVGFMFRQTRVKGIRFPFHTDFPEVNLRFYVQYKEGNDWKRGVVFINEIVPKPLIALIANKLFKEKYIALPMRYKQEQNGSIMYVSYQWKKNRKWNHLSVLADAVPAGLVTGSKEEFITEHFWGYTFISDESTGEYQVQHPGWNIHAVKQYHIDCDFADLYGERFSCLSNVQPASVFLAEGSAIHVFSKKIL